jgi:chorismate dehydratase
MGRTAGLHGFAVWSRKGLIIQNTRGVCRGCRYGLDHMEDIVREQSPIRGITPELTRAYLTKHIIFELGPRDYEGMHRYLDLALALDRATI